MFDIRCSHHRVHPSAESSRGNFSLFAPVMDNGHLHSGHPIVSEYRCAAAVVWRWGLHLEFTERVLYFSPSRAFRVYSRPGSAVPVTSAYH
ncbi:hypothetical protein J6590_051715 [Homalodisca vitripennis]|nr:hypothetical protein J6590_051715 [Homalodisca vitripennis]